MRGSSRQSLARARQRLEELLTDRGASAAARVLHRLTAPVTGRDASRAIAVGEEMFEVTALLDRDAALRRALSEPSQPSRAKTGLAEALLQGRISDRTLDLVRTLVTSHWSSSGDLVDAAEELAVMALADAADAAGQLDDLEDELFRFGRVAEANPRLRIALGSPMLPEDRRIELVDALLDGKVSTATLVLVRQAVRHPRGRSLEGTLLTFARLAAEQRERLIAEVRVAVPLTDAERGRLAVALAAAYGREVHMNVLLDPQVVGGLSVRVGDDLIDASIASRVAELRRRLAS
jgi:F-type H+-transporting ATPase subunit delta